MDIAAKALATAAFGRVPFPGGSWQEDKSVGGWGEDTCFLFWEGEGSTSLMLFLAIFSHLER